jgi:hypothetical protein
MTKAPNRLSSLLHSLGLAAPAHIHAFQGTTTPSPTQVFPKTPCGKLNPAGREMTPEAQLTNDPPLRGLILGCLICLVTLGIAASPALANGGYVYEKALGAGPGDAAGQLELAAPNHSGEIEVEIGGSGVAVNDATHDVYVADTNNHRISEFNSSGAFVRTFGKGVNKNPLALEPNVCNEAEVLLGGECQKGAEGTSPGELHAPRFIAVDNSTNPSDTSKGDVYVGDGVGTQAVNELQYLEFSGATEGTYTLTFEGETTGKITYDKTFYSNDPQEGPNSLAADAALDALAKIGAGNIHVVEKGNDTRELVGLEVEFTGALREKALPALGCDPSALTPAGASCSVKIEREGSKFAGEVVSKFTAEGQLVKSWGDSTPAPNGQLTGKNAEEGPFAGKLEGTAVDPAGHLFVRDEGEVFEFEPDGEPVGGTGDTHSLQGETSGSASGIAVNGEDDVYAVRYGGSVEKHSSTGQELDRVSGSHSPDPSGFAFDEATGGVFVAGEVFLEGGFREVVENGTTGEVFGSQQLQGAAGVAVDSGSGVVYAANTVKDELDVFALLLTAETAPATEVAATTMTLHGTVNPEGSPVANCYFEYGSTTDYGQSAECEPGAAGIGSEAKSVPVQAKLTGLRGGTVYHFRVVAVKKEKAIPGNDVTAPATSPLPVLSAEEATEVTDTSATLQASVDPENVPVETCTFEYGTGTNYGTDVPCRPDVQHIGAGSEPVPVRAAIEGLEPNVAYHWRLSVSDKNGEVHGSDHVFVYPTVGSALPDNRAYEMVSPVHKNGAKFAGAGYTPIEVGEDGAHVDVPSIQCYGGSSCTADRFSLGEPVEFSRTAAGWAPTFLAPPAASFPQGSSFWSESADQEMALFSMSSAPGGQDDFYAREPSGSFADIGPITPPSDGVTEGGYVEQLTATADYSHVTWQQNQESNHPDEWGSLGVPKEPDGQYVDLEVYEYSGACGGQAECETAQPRLVGIDEAGKPFDCPIRLAGMSGDGRTIVFTACGALYARVDGGESEAHTVKIAPAAEFEGVEGVSADGSRVFFTEHGSLYDSECFSGCQTLAEQRRLIDLSAGDTSGFGPRVQGVIAISADSSHVYFVADGVLAPGAAPGSCTSTDQNDAAAHCNLYVYESDARYPSGHVAFVASLPEADLGEWEQGSRSISHNGNVTPDGRFLVVESRGDLTPGDTRTDGATQIFRYDADPSGEEEAAHVPQLIRVSIGADGYDDDGNGGFGNAEIATPSRRTVPGRQDPTMSNDGSRVFFQSPIGLTPRALDDVEVGTTEVSHTAQYANNVYEWEQQGVGSCPSGRASGCVYLISDGRDVTSGESVCSRSVCLLGSDGSGDNVFFTTADQLLPQDTDTAVDIYDAQVCSAGEPCVQPAPPPLEPCQGEQCHGIPEPTPSLLAPGTATFNGEGNVAAATSSPPAKPKPTRCKRDFTKKHNKCIKDKKRKKSKQAKKSAHTNRRAK